MPDEISKLALEYLKTPFRIEVAPQGTTASSVNQEIIVVDRKEKFFLLLELLEKETGSVLVFSRTKHGANDIAKALREKNIRASEIHSNKTLGQRRQALEGFKSGSYRVLVATDIAARGIDVKDIALVVNYDLPEQSSDYVHRIGRTGRGGKQGKAISFATPDQGRDISDIERLIKKTIPSRAHKGASIRRFSSSTPRTFRSFNRRSSYGQRGNISRARTFGTYSRVKNTSSASRSDNFTHGKNSHGKRPASKSYKSFDKRFAGKSFNRSFRKR